MDNASIKRLAALLSESNKTLATAESCTGGGLGYLLTSVEGSSLWFPGGIISYSNEAKQELLEVPESLLTQFGAVSEPVAEAMAAGVSTRFNSDYAIAVTGIAGPGGATPGKPVGTVCFGWQVGAQCQSETAHFAGDRDRVREQAMVFALNGLLARMDALKD